MNNMSNSLASHQHFCDICASGAPCRKAQELAAALVEAAYLCPTCGGHIYRPFNDCPVCAQQIQALQETRHTAVQTRTHQPHCNITLLRNVRDREPLSGKRYCTCLPESVNNIEEISNPPISPSKSIKVKTIIRRPSRFQTVRSGYEVPITGVTLGRAIAAVRRTQEDCRNHCFDIASMTPEAYRAHCQRQGIILYGNQDSRSDDYDVLTRRKEAARKKLNAVLRELH